MTRQRACYNCVNGKLERGLPGNYETPDEPDIIECLRTDISEEIFETSEISDCYINFASRCGHYHPIKIFRCKKCHVIMNVPLWSHEIWGYELFNGDAVPMCSEKCRVEYEEEQKRRGEI